jgi:molybdenum cofactor synthesis domain-containing protein
LASIRLAIITVSDGVAAGAREDRSGDAIAAWAGERGHDIVTRVVVADNGERICTSLIHCCDADAVDLVITTGGTGFTERDVTPEATRAVVDRDVPGIPEAIRTRGAAATPYAWLSRGIAGIRGRTLVVNLPGSEAGVRDGLDVLDLFSAHAVQLLRGIDTASHPSPHG